MKKSIFLSLAITLLIGTISQAQNGTLVGLVGHQLVRVNLETAELVPLRTLAAPRGAELRNLIYVPQDTSFYTIADFRTVPQLVRINQAGQLTYVGAISVPGKQVHFCESLSYDTETGKAYASVSLDGPSSVDKVSETLIELDLSSARGQQIAALRGGQPGNDMDEIALFDGQIHIFDGVPDRKTTYFFPFEMEGLSGQVRAGSMQNLPYLTMDDVVAISYRIYFPHAFDQTLYFYDLRTRRHGIVGKLNYSRFPAGVKLTGLALVPLPQA